MNASIRDFTVTGEKDFKLEHFPTSLEVPSEERPAWEERLERNKTRIEELQDRLYAEARESVIVILQAMDAAGKDSTIRHVLGGINPTGIDVRSFKQPTPIDREHGFLWRSFSALPARGKIAVFNRSYYEECLVVRVHGLWRGYQLPDRCLDMDEKHYFKERFEDIRGFERYLWRTGNRIVKVFLNVSAEKQRERFLERIDDAINTLLERLSEEYMIHSYEEAAAHRVPDFDREAAAGEITRLKREKSALGNVNLDSIQDYDTVSVEYESQKKEYDDLIAARADFEKIINDLSNQMLYQFNTEFAKIQDNFQEIFKELFGGGTGKLELEVPEDGDMLEAGVEIYAQPPGKLLKSMSLLSGGEKALTAIAILFAILRLRPMPFVILDETEAALDDTNVEVFARYLHKFSSTTQFIVVTHRKPTMELADRLYGVTMQEKGVSTVVSVTLSEAVKHSSND